MASANSEQLKAIEHNGGVLLKAGAGSGKTFVLKEHMIYQCQGWIDTFKKNHKDEDFYTYIKSKFREVVLMTFTIKAAGELEIRLNKEFQEKAKSCPNEDKEFWQIAVDSLQNLNVSTIHGFCFKLIKQGYFPGVSADQEILSEAEFREEILSLLDEWLLMDKSKELEIYDIILKEKIAVEESLVNIFSDPALRYSWKYNSENSAEDLNLIVQDLVKDKSFSDLFDFYFNPESYSEFEKKPWFSFLQDFCEKKRDHCLNFDCLLSFYSFFSKLDFKIPRKPTGKTIPLELVTFFEKVKDFKDYLKKNGEHFFKFDECYHSRVLPWNQMVKEIVDFVEQRYSKSLGITFSDLEFLVYEGIQSDKIAKKIGGDYRYFIIDEFQDTSFIQFNIIEKIIRNDYSRIFCVGDLKQAIYGFRGGELGVFLDCEKKVNTNLTLSNNYRSLPNIINFNNIFFDSLFKLGLGFKGVEKSSVPVVHQLAPIEYTYQGEITQINVDLEFLKSDEKIKNSSLDYFEALGILDQVQLNLSRNEETAILYKRLKPSLPLIDLLIKKNIGFTSQIKIPFLDDPIIGIFYSIIEYQYNENEKSFKYLSFLVNSYLSLLGGTLFLSDKIVLENFFENINLYGLYQSFCYLLNDFGVHNSNYKNNLSKIELLCIECIGDLEKLLILLKRQGGSAYSLDFQFGNNPGQVQIMTAHASKGLEFENVILGGIYTNENIIQTNMSIGKFPMSFKWTEGIHGKKKFKTPRLIWEEEQNKRKEFSEAKRLFYVANTRAEKNLQYVEVELGEHKRAKTQSGTWHAGIKAWFEIHGSCDYINERSCDIQENYDHSYLEKMELRAPLFHIDNLGLRLKDKVARSVILPEISVTKLATLEQCPKKFYFQNICKITTDELSVIDVPKVASETEQENFHLELSSKNILKNSADRGTEVHKHISGWITGSVDRDSNMSAAVRWGVEKLESFVEKYELISEIPIKFELFGYMISGIPDLVLKDSELNDFQIWDFKTGKINEKKLSPYWFQLYCYAYSQFVLGKIKKGNQIKLVLCFLDEEKLLEELVNYTDVENFLLASLSKLNNLNQENLNECEYCPYKLICQK